MFKTNGNFPFNSSQEELYTANHLLFNSLDFQIAKFYVQNGGDHASSKEFVLTRNEHDSRIMWQAKLYLQNKKVIGFMGGHALKRNSLGYASCARIARELSRNKYLIITGGGPGGMEAAMLGTYFAGMPDEYLNDAIKILSKANSHLDENWLEVAREVIQKYPRNEQDIERFPSLGIATWLYHTEPTNAFSTKIAKIFQNSVREDFLVSMPTHGIIFFQGSMGTVQEIFMTCTLIHYRFSNSPLVFFNSKFWNETIPIVPLLKFISAQNAWSKYIKIYDDEQLLVKELILFFHQISSSL